MSRWWITLGLLAGVCTVAAAAPPRKEKSTAAKKAKRAKLARANGNNPSGISPNGSRVPPREAGKAREASAATGGGRRSENMPRGFTWPPSRAMRVAEAACLRTLEAEDVAWRRASREGRIASAVTIDDGMLGGIAYVPLWGRGPHKLDCQLARALHAIGPTLYAAGVREVRFGSMYRWSNVRVGGKTKNALSRHALGLAIDVVSFVDDTGREARIARDYNDGDPLLHEVARAIDASSMFRVVLTPSNDPISHHDHFHIEANPSYASAARPKRRR
jgi:hypothetical protein